MEFIVTTLVILFLVLLIGSILGFVAMSRVSNLERELIKLKKTVNALQVDDRASVAPKAVIPLPEKIKPDPEPTPASKLPEKGFAKPTPPKPETVAKSQSRPLTREEPLTKTHPTKEKRKWEEEFGARWTVWVGGIALAFGAVFLLRYAAEAGIFTPEMRIGLAGLMGVLALCVGEVLRRLDPDDAKLPDIARTTVDNAYIPGVLTAVGIFTLLGAIYAAYGIYGLFGPSLAFIMLGIISLGGLALGLLHGPKISALGLLAALVTPLLVHTGTPQYLILFSYLLIVGGAAVALAVSRQWSWLTLAAFGGLLAWATFTVEGVTGSEFKLWALYMTLIYLSAVYLFAMSTNPQNEKHTHIDRVPFLSGSALIGFILWLCALMNNFNAPQLGLGVGFAVGSMVIGWRFKSADLKILISGILTGLLLYGLASTKINITPLLGWGVPTMALFLAFGTLTLKEKANPVSDNFFNNIWVFAVPGIPLVTFASWPYVNPWLSDTSTGSIMAVLSIIFVVLALFHDTGKRGLAVHTHLVSAAIAYVLAIALIFTGLSVSLALMAGVILTAILSLRLKSDILPYIALGFGALVAAHVLFLELPTEGWVGSQIIFNQLWIYLALPALLCAAVGVWLGRESRSLGTEGLKALGLTFAALFAVFQIRHLMNGGDLFAYTLKFDELVLQVLAGLSFTLGGTLISPKGPQKKRARPDQLIPNLAMLISGLTLAVFVLGICLFDNPLFTQGSAIRGNIFINSLTLAYLLPAILLAGIAWLSQSRRPETYIRIAAGLSLLSVLLFLTTQIRFIFTGADISLGTTFPDGLELYMISAAWLALGVALLFVGLQTKRRDLRLASAIVIILTVLKAFLIDMAGLEGVLRAMAFVVLGVILIVIGRIYQRLLFSGKQAKQ